MISYIEYWITDDDDNPDDLISKSENQSGDVTLVWCLSGERSGTEKTIWHNSARITSPI